MFVLQEPKIPNRNETFNGEMLYTRGDIVSVFVFLAYLIDEIATLKNFQN